MNQAPFQFSTVLTLQNDQVYDTPTHQNRVWILWLIGFHKC